MKYILIATTLMCSCGSTANLVGLESTSAANKRQKELAEHAEELVKAERERSNTVQLALARTADTFIPGYENLVRDIIAGVPPRDVRAPEPRPDPSEKWDPLVTSLIELVVVGSGLGVAYKKAKDHAKNEINVERDRARVERGEAITVAGALKKGYFEDGQKETTNA